MDINILKISLGSYLSQEAEFVCFPFILTTNCLIYNLQYLINLEYFPIMLCSHNHYSHHDRNRGLNREHNLDIL